MSPGSKRKPIRCCTGRSNGAIADDSELDKKQAAATLARFVNLHPTNIAQKTEIILENFRSCLMHKLQGYCALCATRSVFGPVTPIHAGAVGATVASPTAARVRSRMAW